MWTPLNNTNTQIASYNKQWIKWMLPNRVYPLFQHCTLFTGKGGVLYNALTYILWWAAAVTGAQNPNAKPVLNADGHLRKAIEELHGILRDVVLPHRIKQASAGKQRECMICLFYCTLQGLSLYLNY
jgi:hypothetical protein